MAVDAQVDASASAPSSSLLLLRSRLYITACCCLASLVIIARSHLSASCMSSWGLSYRKELEFTRQSFAKASLSALTCQRFSSMAQPSGMYINPHFLLFLFLPLPLP